MNSLAKAPCEFPCVDAWPLALVRPTALLAYRELERLEQIAIQYPVSLRKDRVEIRYLAALPHEWTREGLKRAEDELKEALSEEQARIARRVEGLVAAGAMELPADVQEIAERYRQITMLLDGA